MRPGWVSTRAPALLVLQGETPPGQEKALDSGKREPIASSFPNKAQQSGATDTGGALPTVRPDPLGLA